MVEKSRGYNLPTVLYTCGKDHEVIEYEGHCRMKSNKGSDVSIDTQQKEERMQRHRIIDIPG